jgi:hypothetical protein
MKLRQPEEPLSVRMGQATGLNPSSGAGVLVRPLRFACSDVLGDSVGQKTAFARVLGCSDGCDAKVTSASRLRSCCDRLEKTVFRCLIELFRRIRFNQ